MSPRYTTAIALSALALATLGGSAAAANLVQNGGFESTTNGPNAFLPTTAPTGWTVSSGESGGVAAIYSSGAADTTGAYQSGYQTYLWGPNDGSANGLPAASPAGGNYLADDSSSIFSDTFSQGISGLQPGKNYTVSFYYAAAQFRDEGGDEWNGMSDSTFEVSLGSQTQTAPALNIASHGFSGWRSEAMTFTATSVTETLSFLAVGGPSGVPPVALLDGVSLAAVPEPTSLALFGVGLLGVGAIVRRQRGKRSAAI